MAARHASLSSRTTPHILTPSASSTTNKPLAPMPIDPLTTISTQKVWVVPPRPKPGRKPALDAPPTKRKAQNREAQRAFRERRAAKVGELEDQMREMEEEDAKEKGALRGRIAALEEDLDYWKSVADTWNRKHSDLEEALGRERQVRQGLELEVHFLREKSEIPIDAVPLPPRRHRQIELVAQQPDEVGHQSEGAGDLICGRCSNDMHCQCIEDAFEMSKLATEPSDNGAVKRPHSPPSDVNTSKRFRQQNDSSDEPTEIDFTTRPPPQLLNTSSSSSIPAMTSTALDKCGFCSNGTTCICAEIERQDNYEQDAQPTAQSNTVPMEPSREGPCTMDPGTCGQCQSNPLSKTFCTSLAAYRTSNPTWNSASSLKTSFTPQSRAATPSTLSCADAFSTLAQHPYYPQASTQLSSWVPQLTTRNLPAVSNGVSSLQGRTPFEIEAASVMEVMKTFDRRYGDTGAQSGGGDSSERADR